MHAHNRGNYRRAASRALGALAKWHGVRDVSALAREALDWYLANLNADEVDLLLGLEGILTESDAQEIRSCINYARTPWRKA